MKFPFYEAKIDYLDEDDDKEIANAQRYLPDDNLVHAVNVAILLKQPLLLTGEPGTGKTQLGFNLSQQLNSKFEGEFKDKKPLVFETKSSSMARDLFYTYDTVGRFHAAQISSLEQKLPLGDGSKDNTADKIRHTAEEFITYNALGKAILFANKKSNLKDVLPKDITSVANEEFLQISDNDWQRRSVVIIDEIDKAPRDFPNDILNEIERMYFRVPELRGKKIEVVDDEYRPVVILTSNSEKNLPDAFLRRCVYHHIKFPDQKRMREIVEVRLEGDGISKDKIETFFDEENGWVKNVLNLFYQLRAADRNLKKTPATAELIGSLTAIRKLAELKDKSLNNLKSTDVLKNLIQTTLGVLIKFEEDFQIAEEVVNRWQPKTKTN
jgi:MoxR-like ATPase